VYAWRVARHDGLVRRVAVVGNSGSGKTTLASALAERLGVPHVELDSLFHQPGWTPRPDAVLRALVDERTTAPGWVVDGNYSQVRDLVWERADTVVWLDLPRAVVMRRVVARTLRRTVTREELWNGNREPWSNLWSRDPDRSIIAWAWRGQRHYRDIYEAAVADPVHAQLDVIRLRSPHAVRRFLRSFG